jgi:nucleotide-binding universal stress UspA family protein
MTRLKETTMYRKIVVGYDDTDQAKDALALGRQLADATGAALIAAGVVAIGSMWAGVDAHLGDADAQFARKLEEAADAAGARPELVPSSSPAQGLHELAETIGADLIVVGSASRTNLAGSLAGTTAVGLLNGSPCAVAIAPRGYRALGGRAITAVVTGFDGSAESGDALTTAGRLAAATGAKLQLVVVAVPPPRAAREAEPNGWHRLLEAAENEAREQLAEGRNAAPDGVELEASLVSGDAAQALASVANMPGTVLVVGSRGYGPLRRVLIGSVASSLVGSARCPLIVTPRGMHETADADPAAELENAL